MIAAYMRGNCISANVSVCGKTAVIAAYVRLNSNFAHGAEGGGGGNFNKEQHGI